MILQSFDGSEFELSIIRGRQWNPHATNWEDYDWVRIHLRVLAPFGTFNDGGPYFLNREVLDLASWLTDIAQSKDTPSEHRSIEEHPWFKLSKQDERFVTFRVIFNTEYGWNYAKGITPPYDDPDFPYVDIEISRNQLQEAARHLYTEHARLPRHWN